MKLILRPPINKGVYFTFYFYRLWSATPDQARVDLFFYIKTKHKVDLTLNSLRLATLMMLGRYLLTDGD
jgi:hypothetical protein